MDIRRRLLLPVKALSCLAVLCLTAPAHGVEPGASGDTPFGTTFNIGEGEVDQIAQFEVFDHAKRLGDTIMFVWRWSKPEELLDLAWHVKIARQYGLKVIIQISNFSQGNDGKVFAPQGFEPTFSDPATRQRFINDAMIVAGLGPEWLNLSPEVNMLYMFDIAEFQSFVGLYKETYRDLRAAFPQLKIGVSYLDRPLVGLPGQLDIPDTLGPRDFIGLTSYPDAAYATPQDIPSHWYAQFADLFPDDTFIISEIGWGSWDGDDAQAGVDQQAEFVRLLPALFGELQPDLIMWALLFETNHFCLSCVSAETWEFLISVGVDPPTLFDKLNSVGLIYKDDTLKPSYDEAKILQFDYAQPVP